jgi:lipopolysaccharide export LptBFGC system permease protein LptF
LHIQQSLKTISTWGKVFGYLMIISGAISALGGLLAFLVGAIPGVICIFLGLYLLRSAKKAEDLQRGYDDRTLAELLENYAKYLRLQGIMMIIAIVLYALMFVIWGGLIFATLGDSSSYY